MKKLETVTLLGVDCVDIDRLMLAVDISTEHIEFADVKLLTSLSAPRAKNIITVPHIGSVEEYSRFMIEKLDEYVDTPHVLIIQYDGFILNPDAWEDDFLKYDYIGAPWLVDEWSIRDFSFPEKLRGTWVVGNGGFSLRSKPLLKTCAELAKQQAIAEFHPEDTQICVHHRARFEDEGVVFAPAEVAKRFSYEGEDDAGKRTWAGQFGFHGIRWTDISKWSAQHPEYAVDMQGNTITRNN